MNRYIISLATLILFSCGEEKIDKPLKSINSDLLVVEGVLTNEKMSHVIKLSHPYQNLNGEARPASGAIVSIFEGNEKVYSVLETPGGSGNYLTEEMTAVFGKKYTLLIHYQGKEFFAVAASVPVEPMNKLQYDKAREGLYQLQLDDSGSGPNYIDYHISWTNTPECQSGTLCEGRMIYYDLKTVDINSLFKPDKENVLFPVNAMVIRKKYSISPEYKAYLRSALSETEWRGGAFDVQRENVPTNLSEGAIGFFAVSTVVSDTTIILEKP